ncbi:hypothetical protein LGH83_01325 [Lichenihabitans sp. PAMC28606]|uniref:hypothetical protein n=1 Tax=Lichenihabitans sp. PAMC28606 TaxID=2880932 RepID=UPI001D09F9D0|nr:hypothetical protein [Lichenihabitans sp. PAMC28606]UDL94944.1 hypothetical protein LGH83_01325 [Lichenihabitans sp. PAMC28606]
MTRSGAKPGDDRPITRSAPSLEIASLPRAVQLLRARILETVRGGDIDDLRVPLGWNEVPPLFRRGQKPEADPVEYLKSRSFDRQGREMLGIMRAVFTAAYVQERRGPSTSYIWPIFPVTNEFAPPRSQQIGLWRCVRFEDLTAKAAGGGPLIHRTAIGDDGTWHYFWTES